jgi:hypothetical protein
MQVLAFKTLQRHEAGLTVTLFDSTIMELDQKAASCRTYSPATCTIPVSTNKATLLILAYLRTFHPCRAVSRFSESA